MEPDSKKTELQGFSILFQAENPNVPIPGYLLSMNTAQEGTKQKMKLLWQIDVCVAVPNDRTF